MMSLGIGDVAPDFTAETTQGKINFHEWMNGSWVVFFSHPKDFTPICTTELGYLAGMRAEFDRRNCKVLGLSVDTVRDHLEWASDIKETQGHELNYPLIGDFDLHVSKAYGMLHPNAGESSKGRTAAQNATVRTVFIIAPDRTVKATLCYPMTSGRNFDEVLRLLDSLQLTAKFKVATPVNWKPGDNVVIAASVSDQEAKDRFPAGWDAPKPYLRIVPQPE